MECSVEIFAFFFLKGKSSRFGAEGKLGGGWEEWSGEAAVRMFLLYERINKMPGSGGAHL